MREIFILLVLLAICGCKPWYNKYGINDKNALSLPGSAPNLIQALDDPSANVRKAAIRYLSQHENSIKLSASRVKVIASNDLHRNVRKEAERLLAIYSKKNLKTKVRHSRCNGFTIINEQNSGYFEIRFDTKYIPSNFRPIDGDEVEIEYYNFNDKQVLLSVEATKIVKNRFVDFQMVIGTIGEFNVTRVMSSIEKIYPVILDNGPFITINLGGDPAYYLKIDGVGLRREDLRVSTHDKVKINLKGHTVGRGSCYVYSVESVEFVDKKGI